MFSVSPAEMVTIAVVALLVFGPRRLPEIARKAGRLARDLRKAAADLRSDIEREYGDSLKPLEDARRELRTARDDISRGARSLEDLPKERPGGAAPPQDPRPGSDA
ncbi:MAG TPA: twin-arginine translocase TatA/TatE family subunit [Acidimicrobiia bacterium]|nr:twin-arginine translocase TatA/TatE family subunit [Acidimicrobiia bacterium]